MLYRWAGHHSESGAFIKPISYLEAAQFPRSMLDVFMTLDETLAIMQRQEFNKKHPPQKSYK